MVGRGYSIILLLVMGGLYKRNACNGFWYNYILISNWKPIPLKHSIINTRIEDESPLRIRDKIERKKVLRKARKALQITINKFTKALYIMGV